MPARTQNHIATPSASVFHWTQLVSRVIVPLWVLTGAALKYIYWDPKLLPKGLLDSMIAQGYREGLGSILAVIISAEVCFASVMLFIKPLARIAATFMLLAFCAVLINELRLGHTSCGCFGSKLSPSPHVMLFIDGALLILNIFIRPRYANRNLASGPVVAAALLAFAGIVLSFARLGTQQSILPPAPVPALPAQTLPSDSSATQPAPPADPSINPAPKALPSYFIIEDDQAKLQSWVGRNFRDLEIFQIMPRWPTGLDSGRHYIVFFSRTCEHCQAMFDRDLVHPQSAPVHAIEIPADRDLLTSPDAWPMPNNPAELLALPLGPNYIITPPVALTIENGVVTCATPHDYRACFGLPPLPEGQH